VLVLAHKLRLARFRFPFALAAMTFLFHTPVRLCKNGRRSIGTFGVW